MAALELGSSDERFAHASGGGGNGNVSFALSAQYQSADDYSLSEDYTAEVSQPEGDRINSDYERSSVFFQFDALESPLGHTSLFYNLSNAHKGLPIESDVEDPAYERLTDSRQANSRLVQPVQRDTPLTEALLQLLRQRTDILFRPGLQ